MLSKEIADCLSDKYREDYESTRIVVALSFTKIWARSIPKSFVSHSLTNDEKEMRMHTAGDFTAPARGLLATDHVILNHGQVTWTTPELAPPLLTTTPHQRKDVSALDRFNVHRCPTRRVFNGTGLELVTRQATIRYLYHSATAATQEKPCVVMVCIIIAISAIL
ncbi:uncharacterized protein TNCV_4443161 [Trichonephila clavipes]|nr:uncharacterized protein TNCV_4443161 [Trichonephila clavipes]